MAAWSGAWSKQWYAVCAVSDLDASKPQPFELLGKQLVIWRAADGAWGCLEDRCPHRAVPLSGGRASRACAVKSTSLNKSACWRAAGLARWPLPPGRAGPCERLLLLLAAPPPPLPLPLPPPLLLLLPPRPLPLHAAPQAASWPPTPAMHPRRGQGVV